MPLYFPYSTLSPTLTSIGTRVLLEAAGADGDDLALLRLFLGGVGDVESAAHLLGLFERLTTTRSARGATLVLDWVFVAM